LWLGYKAIHMRVWHDNPASSYAILGDSSLTRLFKF